MTQRGGLGTRRVRLGPHDVCVDAISFLEPGYAVLGIADVGLGGRAPKDLVVFPQSSGDRFERAYVAKKPVRPSAGPRECVTEYLLAELGRILPLRVAKGRLARLEAPPGAADDVRFLSRFFLRTGEELRHGVELVAECFAMDERALAKEVPKGAAERAFYTVDFVDEVLGNIARDPETHARLSAGFARMLAYDALVGAQDRHASNWGVIADPLGDRPMRFAPVFDTARGLLQEYPDSKLAAIRARERPEWIRRYTEGSTCLIGTGRPEDKSHFDLIRFVMTERRHLYGCHVRAVIDGFRPAEWRRVLHVEFGALFSRLRLELIDDVLSRRLLVLKEVCDRPILR